MSRFRRKRTINKRAPSTRRGRNTAGRKNLSVGSRTALSIVRANAGVPKIPASFPINL